MSIINTIDPSLNFWELYPAFKVTEPFKELYQSDTSKSKKVSSVTMWFITLCYAKSSIYRNLAIDGIDGKHYIIGGDYCDNTNFYESNKSKLDILIEAFIKLEYTALERHMHTWEDLLNKRTAFIKTQNYDLSTYDDLDKMAIGTDKVYNTIKKIQEDINKDDSLGQGKGGSMASLND